MPDAARLGGSAEMPSDAAVSNVAGAFSVSKQVLWYRLRDLGITSTQRFAAKWPLWLCQRPRMKAPGGGGPTAPVRVLSSRGGRFTNLVLDARVDELLSTNETLDHLGVTLEDLEEVETAARQRAIA